MKWKVSSTPVLVAALRTSTRALPVPGAPDRAQIGATPPDRGLAVTVGAEANAAVKFTVTSPAPLRVIVNPEPLVIDPAPAVLMAPRITFRFSTVELTKVGASDVPTAPAAISALSTASVAISEDPTASAAISELPTVFAAMCVAVIASVAILSPVRGNWRRMLSRAVWTAGFPTSPGSSRVMEAPS